jgi:hypothetical protein
MKYVAAVSAFCLGVWATPCAFATTVTAEQGQVLLNSGGQGYRLVQGPTNARQGDMIVVNPGGMARIVYDDGCVSEVRPPAVVTIAQSPCQIQQQNKAAELPPSEPQGGMFSGVSTTTAIVVGGLLVGGGVTAAILLSRKDKAASP